MIDPNYQLFMNFLIGYFTIAAFANIVAGLREDEKTTKYGGGEAVLGLILLIVIVVVLIL